MEDDKYFFLKSLFEFVSFWWLCKSFPIPKRQRPNREVKFHIMLTHRCDIWLSLPGTRESIFLIDGGMFVFGKKWNVNTGYDLRICQQRIYVIVTQLCSDEWNWNGTIWLHWYGIISLSESAPRPIDIYFRYSRKSGCINFSRPVVYSNSIMRPPNSRIRYTVSQ